MRIIAVLGLLLTAAAQDRPETVIRTTTRLVQIRVMATDSQGGPVTGLRKEELRLLDNRKPQAISSFVFETASTPPAATNATGTGATPAATPPANEYAMILLDWLNPRYQDRISARDYVNKLLKNFQPRQQMALYLMSHNSRLLHDFTFDSQDILQTLAGTEIEAEDPLDPAKPIPLLDPRYKSWSTLTAEEKIFRFNIKILDTFDTLNKVANGLARIPGRKDLIWVTNGFPLVLDNRAIDGAKPGEIEYPQDMELAIGKLNRADVAVYTVDARGLPIGAYGDLGTMKEFAARTGGTAFYGRNDIDEGVRQALEDTRISYTLGFTVPANAPAGLHAIQLTTTRKGVTLRYRESYQLEDARQ